MISVQRVLRSADGDAGGHNAGGYVQALLYVYSVLFGLVLGSFLNVVIYRLPRGESLARPGSHCPSCGTGIHWYDNVPVASWLILRGRCRACGATISPRYLLVEIMTGALFGMALWRFGLEWPLLVAWASIAAMIAVAFIDYDHMIIPNRIVLPGALVGLGASVALDPLAWWVYLVSSVGAAAFIFALVMIWPGGMGPGDIKMALFMGAVLGKGVIVGLLVAFLSGTIVGVYLMVVMKRSRKTKIPFGPFLALGAVLAMFFGQAIIDSYLSVIG
jgi:leader peptidase (prepilin peptidase)/N-methyltransferase